MSKEKFDAGLEDPMKMVKSSKDVLRRAAWMAIYLQRVTKIKWARTSREWLLDPGEVEQIASKRTDMRSNLISKLISLVEPFSWKLLMRAFKALGIPKVDVTFVLHSNDPNEDPTLFTLNAYDNQRKSGGRRVKARRND